MSEKSPIDTKTQTDNGGSVTISKKTFAYLKWLLDEAETQDKLIASLEAENKLLAGRFETEREKTALLAELSESRKNEAAHWKDANDAKDEVIAKKTEQIEKNKKEIEDLKNKKTSLLEKAKAFGAGVLVGIGLRSLL